MALASRPKKETQRIGIKKSKNMLYSGTSLASAESLTVPLVSTLSLSLHLLTLSLHVLFFSPTVKELCKFSWFIVGADCKQVQVVVLSADIRCAECQRRVADIMSRMNGKIS
jgi:hypothetical protein